MYAIVDEVDSVLIDEARTPLIISGPVGNDDDTRYFEHNAAVGRLARKQTELVNTLVGDAERDLEKGETAAAGMKLYKAQLGGPKNKRLLKVLQETGNKTLLQRMELDYIADRRLPASKQQLPRARGRPAVRARREGALGAPHRSRGGLHVAQRP